MRNDLKTLGRILSHCKYHTLIYVIVTIIVASRNFLITYLIAFLSKTVIRAVQGGSMTSMQVTIINYLILLAVFILADTASQYLQSNTIHKIGNRLRAQAMNSIMRAEMAKLDAIGGRVEVITRMNSDIDLICDILGSKVLMPLMYLISGIGAAISIFDIDILFGFIMIAVGVLISALDSLMAKPVRLARRDYQESRAALARSFEEDHRLSMNIKLMNMAERASMDFEGKLDDYQKKNDNLGRVCVIRGFISQFDGIIRTVGVVLIGILLNKMGRIGVDEIAYGAELAPLIITMLSSIGGAYVALQNSMTGVDRVHELMALEGEDDSGKRDAYNDSPAFIECRNAGLRYANGNWGFRNLNMTVPDHQIVGLHGASGSGKSSLLRSIMRLYRYTDGRICLFGHDVKDYSLPFLRKSIAYVQQENLLFEGTYLENLRLGNEANAPEEKIMAVLELIGSTQWIEARGGLNANVTEGGRDISGGQRQQIAIARALMSDRRIIIFDEAFAGVDAGHIEKIMTHLDSIKAKRAILIISHDEKVLDRCDRLLSYESSAPA